MLTLRLRSLESVFTCFPFPVKETFILLYGFSSQSVRAESGSADDPALTGSKSVRVTAFLIRKGVVYCFQGYKVSYLPLGGKESILTSSIFSILYRFYKNYSESGPGSTGLED